MDAYVKHNIENHIATIEFFHPEQNSLPGTILSHLANMITEIGNLPEVKVIILKSGGDRTFCAGASFQELISIENEVAIWKNELQSANKISFKSMQS